MLTSPRSFSASLQRVTRDFRLSHDFHPSQHIRSSSWLPILRLHRDYLMQCLRLYVCLSTSSSSSSLPDTSTRTLPSSISFSFSATLLDSSPCLCQLLHSSQPSWLSAFFDGSACRRPPSLHQQPRLRGLIPPGWAAISLALSPVLTSFNLPVSL